MTKGSPSRSRRRRAARATELLEVAYGSPTHRNKTDPLDELVFIVLSQMTTGPSYERVYERLKGAFPSWEPLLSLPVPRLAELIEDAGLSQTKAPRLIAIMKTLQRDFGDVTLDPIKSLDDAAAEAYLVGLPGVGTKTAKCVLMYSMSRMVLPVDTHVFRVASRLNLTDASTPATSHGDLEDAVEPKHRYSFHVNALAHGREKCLARAPRCERCPLRRLCGLSR